MEPLEFIWRDGELIGWDQATTHALTHALHYGFAVFGGIRSYEQADGAVVEGRGENLFMIKNNCVRTPHIGAGKPGPMTEHMKELAGSLACGKLENHAELITRVEKVRARTRCSQGGVRWR